MAGRFFNIAARPLARPGSQAMEHFGGLDRNVKLAAFMRQLGVSGGTRPFVDPLAFGRVPI